MKKITILSSFPPIKGITPYTVEFIKALDIKNEVTFLGFKNIYPEFLYPQGTKDTSLETPILKNTNIENIISWYNPISWIQAGLKIQGDSIHAQWWSWPLFYIYIVILIIAKIRGKQVVLTVHNVTPHEKSIIKNFCNNIVYKLANKFIVHSEGNKKTLGNIVGIKKDIKVIPHGILKPKEKLQGTKGDFRAKYNIGHTTKVILFFGNIREYKGLDILLESFSKLVKKDTSYKLIIAGPCWKDWEKYQNLIESKDISGYILRLDGFIGEKQAGELFTLSDMLVLPYKDFDSQSGVIATNLYYNLPVIVSNLGGLTEVITDPDLIFNVGNINELTQKIDYLFQDNLLDNKKKMLSQLKEQFEWDNIVKQTLDFYNK